MINVGAAKTNKIAPVKEQFKIQQLSANISAKEFDLHLNISTYCISEMIPHRLN